MSKKFHRRSLFTQKRNSRFGLPCFKKMILAVIVFLAMLYGAIFLFPVVPSQSNTSDDVVNYQVKIKPQSGLGSIADQLSEQGLRVTPLFLKIGATSLLVAGKLKPGTYLLELRGSLGRVLMQMARGDRLRESIAIIPGMTIWQLRDLIDLHPSLVHQTKGISTKELLLSLNLSYASDEGLFFPDTYLFDPDEPDINIYRRSAQAMQKQLTLAWEGRGVQSPIKTPYELLVLASIIEKETGRSSDRDLVAAVFTNRLKKDMLLQTDPTVIYGIGSKFNGNLRKTDLRKDSPYNTYMRKGLPPTPIAMPSKESLHAAAHPADSGALYFVAKGDGTSHFSNSLSEHDAAVDRYQRKPSQDRPQLKPVK